jgi:hypothetical protein
MKILITESQLLTILEQKPPQSVVKSFVKGLVGSTIDKGVSKVDFADLVNKSKQKFDLTKTTPSQVVPKKPTWNYDIVKISDNLQLIRNPKGGGVQYKNTTNKTVVNTKTKEHIDLKWNEDELGKFYYFSANMKNPVDAGRAIETLKKEIPSGSRFGESVTGSLSTDSFYSMLRRLRQFTPKVVGYIKLNDSGVKRFQEYIKNVVPKQYYPLIAPTPVDGIYPTTSETFDFQSIISGDTYTVEVTPICSFAPFCPGDMVTASITFAGPLTCAPPDITNITVTTI